MQKEMESKVARILYLLNRMDKGAINLRQEAEKLRVTQRTLQRDMKALQEAEFPIYDPKPGIYTFSEGYSLEKMNLSPAEASVLGVMSDVAGSLGKRYAKAFLSLKHRFISHKRSPFFIKIEQSATPLSNEIVMQLETTIAESRVINIYYHGRKPCYCNSIKPLKICWMDGFWYLIALTEPGNVHFKFRVDKIAQVIPQQTKFSYSGNIDGLLMESKNIWFGTERNITIKLLVSGNAVEYFKKHDYFPSQNIEKEHKNDSITVSCRANNFMEVLPQIKRWIPCVKVITPIALAETLKAEIKAYMEDSSGK